MTKNPQAEPTQPIDPDDPAPLRPIGSTSATPVKIALKRMGKIRAPYYRIVVANSRTKRDGHVIEAIGMYRPRTEPSVIQVDSERAQYWLSVGAQPTEQVLILLKLTGEWKKFKTDDDDTLLIVNSDAVVKKPKKVGRPKTTIRVRKKPKAKPPHADDE